MAAIPKTRFAFSFDESLLDLTKKLSNKEDEMLNKHDSETPVCSVKCNFRSMLKGDGFHFRATQRKRKAEVELDVGKRVELKRRYLPTGGNGIKDPFSSFLCEDEETELQVHNGSKGLTNSTEPMENDLKRIEKLESKKFMEKLLRNIREFYAVGKSIDCRLKTQLPFALSQLWSWMSCTKYLVGDETTRVLDQKIVACLSKAKVNYASWKMTQKDLQSVEQMAIDHVARSKSSDLECRLVLKLRKLSREMGIAVEESDISNAASQQMKSFPSNTSGQLTWNGEVQRKFHCEFCTYQTDNRSHLLRHQSSIHNMFKPYHCYICTKEFSRVEHIKQHLTTAHPGVQYDATRAKNELVFREQFQKQNQESKRSEEFSGVVQCNQDRKKENANGSLQKFQPSSADYTKLKKLNFNTEDRRSLLCPYCDFTAQNSAEFLQHFEKCRPNISAFCCHVCHEAFLIRDHLQVHYTKKHFSILYCCDQCPFYSTSLYTYDWHIAKLHCSQTDQNSCPICSRSFNKQNELMHHIELVHLKQPNCRQKALASGEMYKWNSNGNIQYNNCLQNTQQAKSENHWKNGISKNKC